MRSDRVSLAFVVSIAVLAPLQSQAFPLVTSLTENNRNTGVAAAVVTSDSSPIGMPGDAFFQGGLQDESFGMANRTHEYTAVRTIAATGVLTNNAAETLQPFPNYLLGLEYIQIANENRQAANYSIDVTLSSAVKAYLFLDNRNDGTAGNTGKTNTTDPDLGGNLSWVVNDGWTRVNTGFMPNGQADYIGFDEGATVGDPTLRTHAETAALIPGSGNGLNQFFAIYTKSFLAGTHVGFTKQQNLGGNNMYGIALALDEDPPVLGDTDGDGVGGEYPDDFLPILNNFRKSPRTRAEGDLTGNGLVNFDDFRQWKTVHGASGASLEGLDFGALGNVPEPSTGLMSLMAAVAGLVANSRRRRVARSVGNQRAARKPA